MKILLFTLEYPPFYGGVANYYGNIVKYWPEPVNIFVLPNNGGKLISEKLPFLKWLPSFWHLWRAIKKEKIGHILVGHILPLGTAAYLVSRILPIKYSVILHGMDLTFAVKTKRKRWLTKKILKYARNIFCGNSYTAEMAKKAVDEKGGKKVVVVNPGVEVRSKKLEVRSKEELFDKYGLKDKIILLSVGRLVKRKGFDMVIEAFSQVLKQIPNIVYVIAGSGEEINNLKFKIGNLKLKNNIILLANVQDDEKYSWYEICDIFIMPAREIDGDFEGFGIVYLEANLAGKPVIAGDSGGVRDAVIDGLNGLIVNPESVQDISQAIIRLAEDENLRKKLGKQGRERAVKEFNWEKQMKKMYNILNLKS